jgi:hypothetical protein
VPPASERLELDKYIYLELCFLLLGMLGYANVGYLLSIIYWVVRGFGMKWFVYRSFRWSYEPVNVV